jgi:hypothetical protein
VYAEGVSRCHRQTSLLEECFRVKIVWCGKHLWAGMAQLVMRTLMRGDR